ncbi:MAG TPA: DUF5309 family protein [Chloroflexota bacterium]|jgi:hypothetical protein|nr:DUF5309 family protein [Chloroflexota bacterium]
MSTVVGQGTTFNLPNYHGELFVVTPTETPFLSAIGGLGGAKKTTATTFEWQTVDRRTSSANNVVVEGANAPTGAERARGVVDNVVEVHHSAIEVSYTRLAATGNFGGANIAAQSDDAVLDELTVQTMAELEAMAVDVEKSFLTGIYQKPSDNTTARQTRGILSALATNVTTGSPSIGSATVVASTGVFTATGTTGLTVNQAVYVDTIVSTTGITAGTRYFVKTTPSGTTFTLSATPGGAALTLTTDGSVGNVYPAIAISRDSVNAGIQAVFDNGGKLPQDQTVLMVGSGQKVKLSNAYQASGLNWPTPSRNVGGVAVDTLVTDFGTFGVMLNRWMPAGQIGILDLSVCSPVFLEIPDKGLLFVEELARVGAARKFQLYGEIGLEYGPETYHGLINHLA